MKLTPKKLGGRIPRPPFRLEPTSQCFFFFFAFFLVAIVLFSLPLFMEKSATNVLLQLIDCIESLKNEVKKKMIVSSHAVLYQSHTRKE
jgi:nucleoside recognition membrane protein YjiH